MKKADIVVVVLNKYRRSKQLMTTPKQVTKVFLIVLTIFGTTSSSFTTDFKQNNLDELSIQLLYKRWVLSNFSSKQTADLNFSDTLKYIPHNSKQSESLHYQFRFGGISFLENGEFIKHWWNKCGTGDPPDHIKGTWTLINIDGKKIIQVRNLNEENIDYQVVLLKENELQLIDLTSKRK